MSTLRELLNEIGFEWGNGRILYQPISEDAYCPGWAGVDEILEIVEIYSYHEILDEEFNSGYGAPYMPRFYARDSRRFYHPSQYDGSTCIETIEVEFDGLIGTRSPLPYPGG